MNKIIILLTIFFLGCLDPKLKLIMTFEDWDNQPSYEELVDTMGQELGDKQYLEFKGFWMAHIRTMYWQTNYPPEDCNGDSNCHRSYK